MKANYVGGRGNGIGVICKMLIELTNYDELGLAQQYSVVEKITILCLD